jgi:hypothetical protein
VRQLVRSRDEAEVPVGCRYSERCNVHDGMRERAEVGRDLLELEVPDRG